MNKSFACNQNSPGYSKKDFQCLKAAFDSKKAQPRGNKHTWHSLFIQYNMKPDALADRQEGRQELSHIFNFKSKNSLISVICESSSEHNLLEEE